MLARATFSTYGTTSGREACCRLSIEQGEIASTRVVWRFVHIDQTWLARVLRCLRSLMHATAWTVRFFNFIQQAYAPPLS